MYSSLETIVHYTRMPDNVNSIRFPEFVCDSFFFNADLWTGFRADYLFEDLYIKCAPISRARDIFSSISPKRILK